MKKLFLLILLTVFAVGNLSAYCTLSTINQFSSIEFQRIYVSGRVYTKSEEGIPSVKVTILADNQKTYYFETDIEGNFDGYIVITGYYTIKFELAGYILVDDDNKHTVDKQFCVILYENE